VPVKDWTSEEIAKELGSIKSAVTVPVNLRFDGKQRILDLSEMEEILREARVISIGNCGCREKLHRCDAPVDTCFSLDKGAEELISKGLAKKASLTEALAALRRSHEAGLVHVSYTFRDKDKPGIVCSCCSCCCQSLSALVRFGVHDAVVASKYVAETDGETCVDCGKCVERCQFKARKLEKGRLSYDRSRCFGCGLCVSTCPTGSVSLVERKVG
jgi:Fe-S-cluster-containing hydrogenase component 2